MRVCICYVLHSYIFLRTLIFENDFIKLNKQENVPRIHMIRFVTHALLGFALTLVGSREMTWNETGFKVWETKWFMGLKVHQYGVKHANPLL